MITSTYNSYAKKHIIYYGNKECAILTRNELILISKKLYTISEICEMIDCCLKTKN